MVRTAKISLLIIIFLLSFSLGVSADEIMDCPNEYKQMLEALPEEIAELLPEKLFSDSVTDLAEGAKEAMSFGYIVRVISEQLGLELRGAIKIFASVLGVLIFSAVLNSVRNAFSSEEIASAFSVCSRCAVFLTAVGVQYGIINSVAEFFRRLCIFANSLLPLGGALYAMGGNVARAVVHHSSLMIFITLVENLCAKTVIPAAGICIAFSAANAVAPDLGIGGVSGFFKKAYAVALGFIMTVFVTVMGTQSLLASKADSLTGRTARFAVGNLIPMVGAALSGTLGAVSTGIEYIRATVGAVGIVVVVLMLLPTVITLLLTKLVFSLTASAADILGCISEKKLIDELSLINGFLLASASVCSVCFIIIITLFTRCSSALGGVL